MRTSAVTGERRTSQKEVLVFMCYRFLEWIDGERGFLLIPYKIVQLWKMAVLDIL